MKVKPQGPHKDDPIRLGGTRVESELGPVHINDGSSHDRAMAWSQGHTAGYEEAEDVLRQMLIAIPAMGLVEGANRYDTDDKHILHVWRDGKSYDIEVSSAALRSPDTEETT